EYRTERESYSKVISYGNAGNGASWFKVWSKSGQVMEYGNTADSKIEVQGKATVATWALNKLSDTKGNYFTVTYTEDNANGDYYPKRIDYTGNANTNTLPMNSVQFEYEDRPDVVPMYRMGGFIKTLNRLKKLAFYLDAAYSRDFSITYMQTLSLGASVISNISECVSAINCKEPIQLNIGILTKGFDASVVESNLNGFYQFGSNSDIEAYRNILTMDVNGDGLTDMVVVDMVNGLWRLILSNGHGFNEPVTVGTLSGFFQVGNADARYRNFFPIDVNGDGKMDIVAADMLHGIWRIIYSNGASFDAPVVESNLTGFYQFGSNSNIEAYRNVLTMDVNGDGLTDMVVVDMVNGLWRQIKNRASFGETVIQRISNSKNLINLNHTNLISKDVYTKDISPNASVYPKLDVQAPIYVVSSVSQTNGVGGTTTTTYKYGGL
ncbi:MAG: VCBS repeat-containing protein, partial [Methylobacterium sp.]|uniref:FG-GAP repeat domain-containing protein n=1 Tax=Methylobacterium sp. TaxID=409 RepID=UPI002725E6C3